MKQEIRRLENELAELHYLIHGLTYTTEKVISMYSVGFRVVANTQNSSDK